MRKSERLLQLYAQGKANKEELALVEIWYAGLKVPDTSGLSEEDKQKQLAQIRAQLPGQPVRVWRMYWKKFVIAASVILLLGTGALLFFANFEEASQAIIVAKDVEPGVVGATLTLANGKAIKLDAVSEGEIAEQAGVRVSKTADGQLIYHIAETTGDPSQINTLSTANGQTYMITLPDKSRVWLNAASSLTYSAALNMGKQRKVSLRGEAYFEVAKRQDQPFVVTTSKQEIHVLGTHFNVNSYAEEAAVHTTLLEGSVAIVAGEVRQILKPGEQALNNGHAIRVRQAEIDNIIDWKEGDFCFNDVDFKTAMQKIARWYDVDVIYDRSFRNNIETGGWIARKNRLSSVLQLIESSGLAHFKIQGRKVHVYQ